MRFVYFGSGYFSRCILETLCARKKSPVLVVSQPDKAHGRGMKLAPMEVTALARASNLPLITPSSLKTKEAVQTVAAYAPEIIVVADYGKLLPPEMLRIPSIMPLAIHPSILPRWRGAAPIARAILNGDTHTGISIFRMNERLDAGEIIWRNKIPIDPAENTPSLTGRLGRESAGALIETLNLIGKKQHTLTPQDEANATYAAKLAKEDGLIHWDREAYRIYNQIRATAGWPGAYTFFNTLPIKILEAEIIPQNQSSLPGTVIAITKHGIDIATSDGAVRIQKVKPQGKTEMDAYAFTLGHRLRQGDRLG